MTLVWALPSALINPCRSSGSISSFIASLLMGYFQIVEHPGIRGNIHARAQAIAPERIPIRPKS